MKNHKTSILLSLTCLLLLTSSQMIYAIPSKSILAAKQKQLSTLNSNINNLASTISKTQNQRNKTLEQLKQTELKIAAIRKNLASLATKINTQDQQLQNLTQQSQIKNQALAKQQVLLATQLRAAYAIGTHSYLKMLLNQEDPNAISRLHQYYHYLNQARLKTMANLKQLLTAIAEQHQQMNQVMQQLEDLRHRRQLQQQKLTQVQQEQQGIIRGLNQRISSKQQRLAELSANKSNLERVIASLKQASTKLGGQIISFIKQRGQLAWPTAGKIINHFGEQIDNSHLNYSGVFIAAKANQAIYAIHSGQVVFANWLRGFGLLLIIEHDHGYMTLYAHNNNLYKSTGDAVRTGDLIATVGHSGGNLQNGLYFEIRNKGKPLNPEIWCNKKQLDA